jgi:hypothetical protein
MPFLTGFDEDTVNALQDVLSRNVENLTISDHLSTQAEIEWEY